MNRGIEFAKSVTDAGVGLTTSFRLPDGQEVDLYQPTYNKSNKKAPTKNKLRKIKRQKRPGFGSRLGSYEFGSFSEGRGLERE